MTELTSYARAGLAVLRRDALIFFSYRGRMVMQFLSSIFSLTLFYYISRVVGGSKLFPDPNDYYAYAVVGLLILSVMNSSLASPPASFRQELVAGTFERLYLSPFGPVASLISMLLFPLCFALLSAAISLTYAYLAFDLKVHWDTAALAIPIGVLGAMSFMPFGMLLLAATVVFKQASSGATWVVAGLSLIGGLYVPISVLPDWMQVLSHIQPFTPATELLRNALVGTPLRDPAWLDLTKCAGFALVLLPIAVWLTHRALDVGRRRATITEY
jgi:ABC-2 type transport system permease protein